MRFEVIARGTGFKKLMGNSDLFGLILSYLNAQDLCKLAEVNRHLLEDSMSSHLWKNMFNVDFLNLDGGTTVFTKASYIRQYTMLKQRVNRAKLEKLQLINDRKVDEQRRLLEWFLDLTQMRIMTILPPISVALTILLLALRFDGHRSSISSWGAFGPTLFLIMYIFLNIAVATVVYHHQFSVNIMRGLWPQMCGPLRWLYTNILNRSALAVYGAIVWLLLLIVEIFLLSAKLSDGERNNLSNPDLPWGVVFIPIWLMFLAFAISPIFGCFQEIGLYAICLVFLWLPLFVFLVCLTIKLSGQDIRSSREESISLSLIFIPLWLMEGSLMLITLCFLVHGLHKYVIGTLEKLEEHVALFFLTWGILTPIVLFESLLCIRSEYGNISALAAVSPILFLFFVVFVFTVVYAYRFESTFDIANAQNRLDDIGLRPLFSLV